MIMTKSILPAILAAALLAGCASQRQVTDGTTTTAKPATGTAVSAKTAANESLAFVQHISDGKVYAQNITGGITFRLEAGKKDIEVPGQLRMRKDKVIRIQLNIPLLGTEVGRLEFRPDGVLLVDRLHKEYVEATYDQVSFLRDNGIDFYSLQALFWNQLLIPGRQQVSESALKTFAADLSGDAATVPVTLTQGKLAFQWTAERATARILSALVTYQSGGQGKSTLDWQYADFRRVGSKMFPARQSFTFSTAATGTPQKATVTLTMSDVKTASDWDTETTLSPKYKKRDLDALLKNITNL